jgi:predicted PurR-regulated permease PerM
MSRRTAAFLVGPIAAAPFGIYETATKGWLTGLIYFAVAFAAVGFVAATYIGPRYLDPDS